MGEVYARTKVHGPRGSTELERVLMDTGAIHTVLERSLAEDLEIRPEGRGRFAIIGGLVEQSIGVALIEIDGRSFRVPIILGDRT